MTWTDVEAAIHAWVVAGTQLSASQVRWSQQNAPRATGPFASLKIISVQRSGHDWVDVTDNLLTIADDVVESVDAAANTLTLTAHGLLTGDGPFQLPTLGTLPGGLELETDYWIVKTGANTIKLATSFRDAMAASPVVVDITDAGTGTHMLVDTATTTRAGEEILYNARGVRQATLSIQVFGGTATTDASPRALLERLVASAVLPSQMSRLDAANIGLAPLGPVQSIDGVVGSTIFEPRATLEAMLHLVSELSETGTYIETIAIENLTTENEFEVP